MNYNHVKDRDNDHNKFPTRHELRADLVDIDTLKPLGNRTRKHPARQLKKLRRIIRKFGFLRPVLVDSQMRVIDGMAIVETARMLGMTEVPVVRITDLDGASVRAARLALNRIPEDADWDQKELAKEFRAILEIQSDFELSDTGFEIAEIDLSFGDDGRDEEDLFPALKEGSPVSRIGDLWQLDQHHILCGDSLAAESYERLLAGNNARMVFADPPYNARVADISGYGAVQHREFASASGEMSNEEFSNFLVKVCGLLADHSADGSLHYICIDWRHVADLVEAGGQIFDEVKNICTWAKPNAGMGSLYRSQTEFICVFKSGTAPHVNNIQLGRHGRNRSNLWFYAGQNSLRGKKSKSDLHPTVKPVAMVADAILDASARGDIILDPFGGSGTSLIAAEKTGRQARLIEIDPAYVDLTIRRFEAFTGHSACLAEDGRPFAEVARDRNSDQEGPQMASQAGDHIPSSVEG